ncbi:MAG: hypothetical protein CL609_19265 [Anaerolineaceae bacterium]|nr:hypothetical protein [Anaerolineaceae bacterium]
MDKINLSENKIKTYTILGLASILSGLVLLIENFLNTSWLLYLLPVGVGGVLMYCGIKYKQWFYHLFGWMFFLCGLGSVYIIQSDLKVISTLGLIFILFGISWLGFFITSYFFSKNILFWAVLPFYNFTSLGAVFLFSRLRFLDFMFFIGFGIAMSLLSAGLYWKLFGLIIPGSLLAGIVPGIYFPWQQTTNTNPLLQTGVMLVWFALGWGLITVFSRVQTQSFVWWPLIPGGILAMVGWGLYIGGSPENAVGFIGNTGSIALIIFGIYILLMKRGLHR